MIRQLITSLLLSGLFSMNSFVEGSLGKVQKQVVPEKKYNNQYSRLYDQSPKSGKPKNTKKILVSILGLGFIYLTLRLIRFYQTHINLQENRDSAPKNRDSAPENRDSAPESQEFKQLVLEVSEHDKGNTLELERFQSIRQRAGADILNQPIKGDANALEYLLLDQNKTSSSPLLMLLVDPKNEFTHQIKVTEKVFVEVIQRVIYSENIYNTIKNVETTSKLATFNLELLKAILPMVEPEILNKKLFKNGNTFEQKRYNPATALWYFIDQKNTRVINILLEKEAYVKVQIPSTEEGLETAFQLAILDSAYQKHLDLFLEGASEELLNDARFTGLIAPSEDGMPLIEATLSILLHYDGNNYINKVVKNMLDYLLSNNHRKKIAISGISMRRVIQLIEEKKHEEARNWFVKMRKKATTPVLANFLSFLSHNLNEVNLRSKILKILLEHQGEEQPAQIDEYAINDIRAKYREEIFEKFDFVPDLLARTIEDKSIIDFFTEKLLEERYAYDNYNYAASKILAKEIYRDELLKPTLQGFKLAVGIARWYSKDYLEYLNNIVNKIDIKILNQPLFGKNESQNVFKYSLAMKSKEILESILTRETYRKKLFYQGKTGFEKAAKAAILTSKYHNDLKESYQNNKGLLTKEMFGNKRKKDLLDYAIEQKGKYESKSLIAFLLSDTDNHASFFNQSEKSFIKAVNLAILDKNYLTYLKSELKNPNAKQLVNKSLFNIDSVYDKNTNAKVNLSESNAQSKDQIRGQIALDYVIEQKATHVFDILLDVDDHKNQVLSQELGIKRLLFMIEQDEKYLKLLKELGSKFTEKEVSNHLGNLLIRMRSFNKEEIIKNAPIWEKMIDILLGTQAANTQNFTITKYVWVNAIKLANKNYFKPLKKIRMKVSKSDLSNILTSYQLKNMSYKAKIRALDILIGDESSTIRPTINDHFLELVITTVVLKKKEEDLALAILTKVVGIAKASDLDKKIFEEGTQDALEYAQKKGASEKVINILKTKFNQ